MSWRWTAAIRRSLMLISLRNRPASPCTSESRRRRRRRSLAHGKDVWQNAKCWECHGQTGKGDGEKAAGLKDDFGFPIRPADLTSGQFKSGPAVQDIFRTMSTGLSGTPMPSYRDSLPEAGPLGARLLHPLALRLQGSADRRAAADLLRGPDGARRSQAGGGHPGGCLCSGRGPEGQRRGIRHGIGGARARAGSDRWRCCPAEERVKS